MNEERVVKMCKVKKILMFQEVQDLLDDCLVHHFIIKNKKAAFAALSLIEFNYILIS